MDGNRMKRSDNLNLLKFLAAVLVIFSHAYTITGTEGEPLFRITRGGVTFGEAAVAVFLFASGYFVTRSLLTRKSGKEYIKARVGKIYPAFIAVVLLSIFVLGPLVTECPLTEYFGSRETYSYALYLLMIPRYTLPEVFVNNPYANVVNGSLWTLILEVACYAALLLAYEAGLLRRELLKRLNWLPAIAVFVIFGLRPAVLFQYRGYLRPLFLFIVGAEYYIFRDILQRFTAVRTAAACVLGAVLLFAGFTDLFMILVFPYFLSGIIFAQRQVSGRLAGLGKFSYAIYLTAFPIQQVIVKVWPGCGVAGNTLLACLACFLAALPIYYFIEKPCSEIIKNIK